MKRLWIVLSVVAALGVAIYLLRAPEAPPEAGGFDLQELLGGEATGYARAVQPRPFRFPADHGPHLDYLSEWWYLTGNLYTPEGRRFGFQFTIFRFALSPEPRGGLSDWGTRQAYMGHLAVTDVADRRLHGFERFSRGAAGLAGAESTPFAVWLEDWRLEAADEGFPWRLRTRADGVGLELSLTPTKPAVFQGDEGLSRKGPEPGNASHYYSYTRMRAQGVLRLGGEEYRVTGNSWLDREWSTSALGPDLEGWDWFSLQFDNGSELMLYRLRTEDGRSSPFSAGTFIPASGPPRTLDHDDFSLEPLAAWTSPTTGASYPVRWRVLVPVLDARLEVDAVVPDQELDLSVRYWEGAVDIEGRIGGESAEGVGYVELTGYAGEKPQRNGSG